MTDSDKSLPAKGPAAEAVKTERDARRAAALRANLRRRKTQERGREQGTADTASPEPDNLFQRISD